MSMLEATTDQAVFDLFECPLFPHFDLIQNLRDKSISFIFGEYDWVESIGAEVLITEINREDC